MMGTEQTAHRGKGKTISAYTDEKEANRIAFYPSPKGQLLISHPYVMSEWFRQGKIMLPGDQQFDFKKTNMKKE